MTPSRVAKNGRAGGENGAEGEVAFAPPPASAPAAWCRFATRGSTRSASATGVSWSATMICSETNEPKRRTTSETRTSAPPRGPRSASPAASYVFAPTSRAASTSARSDASASAATRHRTRHPPSHPHSANACGAETLPTAVVVRESADVAGSRHEGDAEARRRGAATARRTWRRGRGRAAGGRARGGEAARAQRRLGFPRRDFRATELTRHAASANPAGRRESRREPIARARPGRPAIGARGIFPDSKPDAHVIRGAQADTRDRTRRAVGPPPRPPAPRARPRRVARTPRRASPRGATDAPPARSALITRAPFFTRTLEPVV